MAEELRAFRVFTGTAKHGDAQTMVSVGLREDDEAIALLERCEGEERAIVVAGPWELASAVRAATGVIAGDPQAITHPKTPRLLATALLAILGGVARIDDDGGEGGAPAAPAPPVPKGQGFLQLGEGG